MQLPQHQLTAPGAAHERGSITWITGVELRPRADQRLEQLQPAPVGREHQGGESAPFAMVWICARIQQCLNDAGTRHATVRRAGQGRAAIDVHGIDFRACGQEQPDVLFSALARGPMQRPASVPIRQVGVGAGLQGAGT
jgi:hypothetical protein